MLHSLVKFAVALCAAGVVGCSSIPENPRIQTAEGDHGGAFLVFGLTDRPIEVGRTDLPNRAPLWAEVRESGEQVTVSLKGEGIDCQTGIVLENHDPERDTDFARLDGVIRQAIAFRLGSSEYAAWQKAVANRAHPGGPRETRVDELRRVQQKTAETIDAAASRRDRTLAELAEAAASRTERRRAEHEQAKTDASDKIAADYKQRSAAEIERLRARRKELLETGTADDGAEFLSIQRQLERIDRMLEDTATQPLSE